MTSVVVTGAGGFIGTHCVIRLSREPGVVLHPIDRDSFDDARLVTALKDADYVLHLAGVNRGTDEEIASGNPLLAEQLLGAVQKAGSAPHVLFASSTQRNENNVYGRSKREAEKVLVAGLGKVGCRFTIAEIPNVFGPSCRPFYNSVVATFCHQLTHGERPQIQADKELELIWIVDLVDGFARLVNGEDEPPVPGLWRPRPTSRITVSLLLAALTKLASAHFEERKVPHFTSSLEENLYRTLVSFAEPHARAYRPVLHSDDRGSLFETVKQEARGGQVFFSSTRPRITRGNHYHTRKYEKFCVVKGQALIRLRRLGTADVIEYFVQGTEPTVVDIPLFHAHSIENVGSEDLLTLFWSNEIFDPADADTHPEQVLIDA